MQIVLTAALFFDAWLRHEGMVTDRNSRYHFVASSSDIAHDKLDTKQTLSIPSGGAGRKSWMPCYAATTTGHAVAGVFRDLPTQGQ